MKKLYFNIVLILIFCCCLVSSSKDCQRFCKFIGSAYEKMMVKEEYKWCENIILKLDHDSKKMKSESRTSELISNGNFSFANVYVKLEGKGDQYFNNETLKLLRSVNGIVLKYFQNITSFDKIRKELPHLKLIIEFRYVFYPHGSDLINFLKDHIEKIHDADYLVFDKDVDLSQLSDKIKEKLVLELDEIALNSQTKSIGVKTFVYGVKHVLVDVTMGIHLAFQEIIEAVDKNFVCPISASAVPKLPEIYCYYQLPRQSDISVLTPDKIPSECNRIIVKSIEISSGTIKFKDDESKSYMETLKNSTAEKIIASLSCKDIYLDIGPKVNESTLINNLLAFVESYNLDGLEINCEYFREINSYNDFLMELKNKLG